MEDIVPEPEARDGEESSSWVSNHFLPKVVCVKESEEEEEEEEKEKKEDEEEKRGGGIINHLMSNLVSPLRPRAGHVSAQNGEVVGNGISGSKAEEHVGSHGGTMKNLISNLFHNHSEDRKQGDEQKKKVDHPGNGKEEPEEESGVVGIIDNIVSHFPTSFPDDAVPTTDEASILIHSIVKD